MKLSAVLQYMYVENNENGTLEIKNSVREKYTKLKAAAHFSTVFF